VNDWDWTQVHGFCSQDFGRCPNSCLTNNATWRAGAGGSAQGCQIKPKITIWENLGGPCTGRRWYIWWPFSLFHSYVVYYTSALWYILGSFGIFYGHLVYFTAIWFYTFGTLVYFMITWYILWSFGTFVPVLVCWIKVNLATLDRPGSSSRKVSQHRNDVSVTKLKKKNYFFATSKNLATYCY
jgi:hypothetical protein